MPVCSTFHRAPLPRAKGASQLVQGCVNEGEAVLRRRGRLIQHLQQSSDDPSASTKSPIRVATLGTRIRLSGGDIGDARHASHSSVIAQEASASP
jgi:hypothetical protein